MVVKKIKLSHNKGIPEVKPITMHNNEIVISIYFIQKKNEKQIKSKSIVECDIIPDLKRTKTCSTLGKIVAYVRVMR